ncbi:hypothetical protein CCR96_19645 [Halochromatium roseum]|nr:hypothetical protein [Halochromatium roseum]
MLRPLLLQLERSIGQPGSSGCVTKPGRAIDLLEPLVPVAAGQAPNLFIETRRPACFCWRGH